MKEYKYIQFYQTINGYKHEATGTDGIMKFDNRLSLENIKYLARKKASEFWLAGIHDYTGFAVVRTKNRRFVLAKFDYPIYKIAGSNE